MRTIPFVILLVFGTSGCGNPNLDKIEKASSCENAKLADEGKSLIGEFPEYKIDGLKCVLDAVNMPEWARADLLATRPLDGRKTAEWEGLVASWSYNGDEVDLTVRLK